jgi:hypothetical protein
VSSGHASRVPFRGRRGNPRRKCWRRR